MKNKQGRFGISLVTLGLLLLGVSLPGPQLQEVQGRTNVLVADLSPNLLTISPLIPLVPVAPVIPGFLCLQQPDPVASFVGVENYSIGGTDYVRYLLSVDNREDYGDALFAPAPDLPPCGLNTNASRTWVGIFDQNNNWLYGFCALGSASDLAGLWFALPAGQEPPTGVWVILWDRRCQDNWQDGYRSSLIPISKVLGPTVTEDLEVQSRYAAIPPLVDGVISPGEWTGAGMLPLYDNTSFQRGTLHVKNDAESLYFLLDMTADSTTGSNPGDDYSGIAFDIGLDGFKSPYVDLKYGTAAGSETLGIQWAVSEIGWTGLETTELSEYQEGFGPSPASSTPHKFYEYRIAYPEVDINFEDFLADPSQLFHARITVKVVSGQPNYSLYYPSSEYGSWHSPMIRVALGLGSVAMDPGAPIIAGIGLVPRTFIDQTNGLATTGPGHQIDVIDTPFGGHLRVIGNLEKLRGWPAPGPIAHYAIGYCNMEVNACAALGTPGFDFAEWHFVTDVRTNYYWDSVQGKYVLDSVSPATIWDFGGLVIKAYPVPSGSLDWYFPNLLFDWRTTGTTMVSSGLYKLHFFGFSGPSLFSYVETPANESTMVVRIDNTRPAMSINEISYKGAAVDPCAIVRLDDADDVLEVNVSAYDPDGYLNNFSLHALYGDNQSFTCEARNYAGYLADGGTGPEWFGAFPSQTFICQGDAGDHWETTCGYTFRVSGWDRAINGYGRIHWNAGHRTITILMPGYEICR